MSQSQIPETNPTLERSKPICLSGGAKGADSAWGTAATAIGHDVKHWSFPSHDKLCPSIPESQVVPLTDSELTLPEVTSTILLAAIAQNLQPPSEPHHRRLIQRIYYQVALAESCYAITTLGVDSVTGAGRAGGGTMWAVTMFRLLHAESRRCFVFDQSNGRWLRILGPREEAWEVMDADPPGPEGIWAGVGSRDLRQNGKEAIWRVSRAEFQGIEKYKYSWSSLAGQNTQLWSKLHGGPLASRQM
ncbi:hypothetical protein EJ03DRAFT_82101 [Teratosphaeria nubilosa]|uniref:Uncharacterized protein n=1 Tax=Teratosphaeria nubilosa TaxID=161662 RepID=A0A6G1LAH2_9PEZI|nr:hypothetical protein EJ03DRAFT_82101 [Teratosphaeria nubilosa]